MRIIEKQVTTQMMDLTKENKRLSQNLADKETLAESLSGQVEAFESEKASFDAELARTQMHLRKVQETLTQQT